jgi:hypothetical protein
LEKTKNNVAVEHSHQIGKHIMGSLELYLAKKMLKISVFSALPGFLLATA